MTTTKDSSRRQAWLVTGSLVVGLGAGPFLATLLPLAPWTAAAVLLGMALGTSVVLSSEARAARLDLERARPPWRPAGLPPSILSAVLSSVAGAVALLQAAWGATALAHLALDGSPAVTREGVAAWMGAEQGFLGRPGWQGSADVLLALGAVLLLVALVLAGRRWRAWTLGLLLIAATLQLAVSVRLWLPPPTLTALMDPQATWPGMGGRALAEAAPGLAAGLLLAGAGTGVLHAVLRRARGAIALGAGPRLLPLALAVLGLLVVWPGLAALGDAPRGAPAPHGRDAASILLGPPALLGAAGWQMAWFVAVLCSGVLGAIVVSQPALHRLESALGLSTPLATTVLAALLAIVAVPCVLLPGTREALVELTPLLLLVVAAAWMASSRGGRLWARGLGWLCAIGLVVMAVGYPLRPAAWTEQALSENGLLALGLVLALAVLWWPALLLVAALRARALSRTSRASPAAPRIRA